MSKDTIVVEEDVYTNLKLKVIDLGEERLMLIHELEALKNLIRDHSNNRELLKTVGPSRAEQEAQKERIRQLDRLDYDEDRETWERVMAACQVYEERYC